MTVMTPEERTAAFKRLDQLLNRASWLIRKDTDPKSPDSTMVLRMIWDAHFDLEMLEKDLRATEVPAPTPQETKGYKVVEQNGLMTAREIRIILG